MFTLENIPQPEVKIFALVRDRNGKPRIDGDPRMLPDEIKNALTPEEMALAITEYENET